MKELKEAIQEYTSAIINHAEIQHEENVVKDKLQKSRHAVVLAREKMRALDREIMDIGLRDLKPLWKSYQMEDTYSMQTETP